MNAATQTVFDAAAAGEITPQDAFNNLLSMVQDEAGNIVDQDAYQLLMLVYEGWKASYESEIQALKEVAGLQAALKSVTDDRDMLAHDVRRRVRAGKESAAEAAYQSIVRGIASKYAIDEEAAEYLLSFITGQGTHAINPYAERLLTEGVGRAAIEIQDFITADGFYGAILVEAKARAGR